MIIQVSFIENLLKRCHRDSLHFKPFLPLSSQFHTNTNQSVVSQFFLRSLPWCLATGPRGRGDCAQVSLPDVSLVAALAQALYSAQFAAENG